ncbi:MAG TPA: sensor domain-containing diguanylate cyclase [Dehalococcoidia bacterium]|nr:sensor domain-containing diguanylate cyclase [Dehalococcoidia bacterium]
MERRKFPPLILIALMLLGLALSALLVARVDPDAGMAGGSAMWLSAAHAMSGTWRAFMAAVGLLAFASVLTPGLTSAHRAFARRPIVADGGLSEIDWLRLESVATLPEAGNSLRLFPTDPIAEATVHPASWDRLLAPPALVPDEPADPMAEPGWLFRDAPAAQAGLAGDAELTRAIVANLGAGVVAVDETGRVSYLNPTAAQMLDRDEEQVLGRSLHPDLDLGETQIACLVREVRRSGRTIRIDDAALRRPDGSALFVSLSIAPLEGGRGVCGAVLALHDVSERRAPVTAPERTALHDPLTELPNRILFRDRLRQALLLGKRSEGSTAVLAISLDGFEAVNDRLGHQAGDELLQQVAVRCQLALRATDTVARMGGDEFAAVLPGADSAGATRAAQQIVRAVERPFGVAGQTVYVGASVGIAAAPAQGTEPGVLLRCADAAMCVARSARCGIAVYADGDDRHIP